MPGMGATALPAVSMCRLMQARALTRLTALAGVADVAPLAARLEAAGVPFTRSMSGRAAIFFRDPDANVLEAAEVKPWR